MSSTPVGSPEAAARLAREELGEGLLGPLTDILSLVEETASVPVAVLRLQEGIAGAYLVRRERPFVFLNGTEVDVRLRFTLAHEFGHHRLDHGAVLDGVEAVFGASKDPRELEANAFAAEFLAPGPAVREWTEANHEGRVTLETVVRIAVHFGISAQAARYRLAEAGPLKRLSVRRELDKQINRGMHRQALEWLGLAERKDALSQAREDMPRLPARMRSNALEAYRRGLIDEERLAALLQRDRDRVDELVRSLGLSPEAEERDW